MTDKFIWNCGFKDWVDNKKIIVYIFMSADSYAYAYNNTFINYKNVLTL